MKRTIKPQVVQVSFMPKESCERVRPPIIAGQRDSIWVYPIKGHKLKSLALAKIKACYGIEAEILD